MTRSPVRRNDTDKRTSRRRKPDPVDTPGHATPADAGEAESASGAAPDQPSITVELDSMVSVWPGHARSDVLLRGRVTSVSPPDSFTIHDPSGLELASVQFGQGDFGQGDFGQGDFGQGDETARVTPPEGGPAFQAGFGIWLPLQAGEGGSVTDLWVRARGRDDTTFEAALRLGRMDDRVTLIAGPARDLSDDTTSVPRHNAPPVPRGMVCLEEADLNAEGFLRVQGWALSATPVVAVQVFADGDRVAAASHARERPDVAEVWADYPNARHAGFLLERAMGHLMPGVHTVTVQVLCLSGACHAATIPLRRPPGVSPGVPPARPDAVVAQAPPEAIRSGPAIAASTPGWDIGRAIVLICDHATLTPPDVLRIEGWTACGYGIQKVVIEIDGQMEGEADYGRERLDVAAEFPGMPVGTGFFFEKIIPGLAAGPRTLRIIAVSKVGDEKDIAIPLVDPSTPAFRFELDVPATHDGMAVDPITGRMTLEGWALARDGMAGIDVLLDGVSLGPAHHGVVRPDVGAAFPGWEGAVRAGYTFHCPPRALPNGEHLVELVARSKTGETHTHAFRVIVRKTEDPEASISIRRRVSQVERDTMDAVLTQLGWRPPFHLIVAAPASVAEAEAWDDTAARRTLASIAEQSWPHWRTSILVPDARSRTAMRALLADGRYAPEQAARFAVVTPRDEAWDRPLARPEETGLIGVLYLGDELGRDALESFALATGLRPAADCLYADEFRLPPARAGEKAEPEPFFKPDFSPTLLSSMNYVGRPLVVRPGVLAATGVTAAGLMREGLYDLALRCTESATAVHHVRELLSRTDAAQYGTARYGDEGEAALTRAFARQGIAAQVSAGMVPGTWRVRRTAPIPGKVSIIIPTCAAKGYIEMCLKTLRGVTANRNFEIVCVDNIPETETAWKAFIREHADRVVDMPAPFNWSRFNNRAADVAEGEYLLFLNDDIEIVEPDWLDVLLEEAARPEVGIVGARLLYPGRTVQHAGMFLGAGIGRHAFRHAEEDDPGYFGLALTPREVIAVTGACMMVRRAVFDRLGRFDEAHDIVNNDLDFCLRAHRAGLLTVFTPYATLIHHELASRENLSDDFDTARFTGQWRTLFAAGDPYFNPRLSRHTDSYQPDDEGLRAVWAGHPLIHRDTVKRILVVKLDHIGDFVTALPAIRRLKALFPAAHLTVLAAPASTAFAATEPAIDAFIPFEFFHARSQLGERELTADDLAALTEHLAPHRFDIAIDLRKHMSTRPILRCSGARVLAGYDSLDRYPWLDIALEWEGDKALQHKRNHITDDLLHLVAAVDAACEPNRRLIDPRPPAMRPEEMPDAARPLFARPVVVIHPGAGNVTKQWPEGHVADLIGLLLERNDVAVLLIGGAEEQDIAAAILDRVGESEWIASAVGAVSLRDLPRLLAACALYIGNDSGPKHLAAAMGVPTIGVHSGVVDPGEWAPLGERGVALYRNMSCAPCYLSKAEDCPRGLACLRMLEPALVYRMAETFLARPLSAPSLLGASSHAAAPKASPVTKPSRKPGRGGAPGRQVTEV